MLCEATGENLVIQITLGKTSIGVESTGSQIERKVEEKLEKDRLG